MVQSRKLIIPVFFGVETSDVKHQSGAFSSAFKRYEANKDMNQDEVRMWKDALREVAGISGYNLKDIDRSESKLVQVIVKKILDAVNTSQLDMPLYLVGHNSHITDLEDLLDMEVDQFQMIGLHGMGGIGKTTLAKAVYTKILKRFEACSFISDVRETSKRSKGLESLQQQLLTDIFKDKDLHITDGRGVHMLRERLPCKRILVVLDDVDKKQQLEALAGNWFHKDSRVIITTRDKKVLLSHGIEEDKIYSVKELNPGDSMSLFCYHSFRRDEPPKEYRELSREVVSTCDGLPLALEVLGSQFFDVSSREEWRDLLKKLKRYQNKQVHERLKISYDELDHCEKQVFLDIACFFIGMYKELPIHMWEASDLYPTTTIKVLLHKSLIKIAKKMDDLNYVEEEKELFAMHDQIRDMGRTIVLEGNDSTAGRHSRLWGGANKLLKLNQDPGEAEGIVITESEKRATRGRFSAACFERMTSQLRFLHIEDVSFQGKFQQFPTNLKWLQLKWCDFDQQPPDFNFDDIIILELFASSAMACAFIEQGKVFSSLKLLDLSKTDITMTPNFTNIPSLEKLVLRECGKLTAVAESIGALKSLAFLDLTGCVMLNDVPETICQLRALKGILLGECNQISSLPNRLDTMESLEMFVLDGTNIVAIPDSIGKLRNLHFLSVKWCNHLKVLPVCIISLRSLKKCSIYGTQLAGLGGNHIDDLMHVKELKVPCSKSLALLPHSSYETMCELDLSDPLIEGFPDLLVELKNLQKLSLKCKRLKALPDFIGSLGKVKELKIECIKLEAVPELVGELKELELFELQSEKLKALPNSIGLLEKLKNLKLKCKSLEILADTIEGLKELEILDVRSESLSVLPDLNSSLRKLKKLKVECMNLEALPDSIGGANKLELFEVHSKHLKEVPIYIGSLGKLKKLKLRCKCLTSLPDLMGELKKLEFFELQSESLNAFPDFIWSLAKIKEMKLECVNLKALPHLVQGLTKLESFEVLSERLKNLPETIGSLGKLKTLKLKCKNLKVLPCSMGELRELESFELHMEKINVMTDIILSLRRLKRLKLECFYLEALPQSIDGLTKLELLKVQSESLLGLPDSIVSLGKLRELQLNCKNLEALPKAMGGQKELGILELQSESLKDLPDSIGLLKKIKKLALEGCKGLISLPSSIRSIPCLQKLDLVCCDGLTSLPLLPSSLVHLNVSNCVNLKAISEISNLKALTTLNLGGCSRLEDIPGLEGIAQNLESLSLPGPESLLGFSSLGDNRKKSVFQDARFEVLKDFSIEGKLVAGSAAGEHHLSLSLPRGLPVFELERVEVGLIVEKVPHRKVHIAAISDGAIVCQFMQQVRWDNWVSLHTNDELMRCLASWDACHMVQITVDMSQHRHVRIKFSWC